MPTSEVTLEENNKGRNAQRVDQSSWRMRDRGVPLREDSVSDQVTSPVVRKGPFTMPSQEDFRRMLDQGLLSPTLPFSKQRF